MLFRTRVCWFAVFAASVLLIASCRLPVGSDPRDTNDEEDNPSTNPANPLPWDAEGLPKNVHTVIPHDVLELAERTLEQPIHRGSSPKAPDTSYVIVPIQRTATTVPNDKRGPNDFADLFMKFANYDGSTGQLDLHIIEAVIVYQEGMDPGDLSRSRFFAKTGGTGALISGSGNYFTVFAMLESERTVDLDVDPSGTISFESYLVISAELAISGGKRVLRDFSYSYIMRDNRGHEEHLIPNDTGRSFKHNSDVPAQEFPFPDPTDFVNVS